MSFLNSNGNFKNTIDLVSTSMRSSTGSMNELQNEVTLPQNVTNVYLDPSSSGSTLLVSGQRALNYYLPNVIGYNCKFVGLNSQFPGSSKIYLPGGTFIRNIKAGNPPSSFMTSTGGSAGQNIINVTSSAGVANNMVITGIGLPYDTTVTSFTGTSVTLSNNLLVNATGFYYAFNASNPVSAYVVSGNYPYEGINYAVLNGDFVEITVIAKNLAVSQACSFNYGVYQFLECLYFLIRNFTRVTFLDIPRKYNFLEQSAK